MKILKRMLRLVPHVRVLRWLHGHAALGLFDRNYYAATCHSVSAKVFPLLHFLLVGAFEGRKPHPLFDTEFYLRRYPEIAASDVNPLVHYLALGGVEGRQPHPLFDAQYYLARYADVREAGVNPLLHFVRHGAFEGRKPHPLFQPDYYLRRYPEARRSGANPLMHFLEAGHNNPLGPHPLFDGQCYLHAKPDVAASGVNPLLDYALSEGRPRMAVEGACQVGLHPKSCRTRSCDSSLFPMRIRCAVKATRGTHRRAGRENLGRKMRRLRCTEQCVS